MNIGIVILEYARATGEDGITIQYIQELCWPDQLKQPQIITLQFGDLNRNDNFFFDQAV